VVAAIRAGLPGAAESISYGIPTFKIDGHAVLYCAAFAAHYSVYPATATLVAALGDALAPYEYNGKGTIRFPLDVAVPTALITRIARVRAAEDAARPARRRAAAKKR
jgi:uncharacterized protein YdhG (YjbR/CyaY superfamily)